MMTTEDRIWLRRVGVLLDEPVRAAKLTRTEEEYQAAHRAAEHWRQRWSWTMGALMLMACAVPVILAVVVIEKI